VLLSQAKRLLPAPVSFLRLHLHLFFASCFIYLQFLVPRNIFLNHSDIPYLLILGYDLWLGLYYLAAFPGTSSLYYHILLVKTLYTSIISPLIRLYLRVDSLTVESILIIDFLLITNFVARIVSGLFQDF